MGRITRKIPADWASYTPVGATIGASRMFAFKTPLPSELQNRIFKDDRFTTRDLIQQLCFSGKSLGLVINCSNTRRYYDENDFQGLGISYKEIACPGRGFLGRTDLVEEFLQTVDNFLETNSDNDLLIGVNCSNGVNRSGYLICNYLISRLGWSSHDALNVFESARGYPIERGSYVQALHRVDRERRKIETMIEHRIDEGGDDVDSKSLSKRTKHPKMADDSPLAAQMMQQFFNMERQFKQVAETANVPTLSSSSVMRTGNLATPFFKSNNETPNDKTVKNKDKNATTSHLQQYDDEEMDDAEGISDEDDAECDDSSPNIDFESMGRIDVKDPASKSQLRRQRRQKREKMFAVMKRGRFWEINEMRREMKE